VLIFEMLCGYAPFQGATTAQARPIMTPTASILAPRPSAHTGICAGGARPQASMPCTVGAALSMARLPACRTLHHHAVHDPGPRGTMGSTLPLLA